MFENSEIVIKKPIYGNKAGKQKIQGFKGISLSFKTSSKVGAKSGGWTNQ
jgi:CO dehydrogenase/acetyl-CoA synthase beta subunit